MPISWTNTGSLGLSTKANRVQQVPTPAAPVAAKTKEEGPPDPVSVLLGIVAALVLLKFVGEHESTAIRPAHIQIGAYNLLTLGLATVAIIGFLKLVFMRWTVPGLSPLMKFI